MPEKTCLYEKLLPNGLRVVPDRFATFLADVGWAHYVFYDRIKHQKVDELYHVGDSHTTTFGGYEASAEILHTLGIDTDNFQPAWSIKPVTSFDLFEPGETCPELSERAISNAPALEITTNGLTNRGCVTRIVNPYGAPCRVLIFGDSFASLHLCYGISLHVSEVVFTHAAGFDYEMIERYQPDYIIGEIAERFLIESPTEGVSLASIVQGKLADDMLSAAEMNQFADTYEHFENLYGPAMNLVLTQIQAKLVR
ncbi:hypothetical protein [Methylobacterium sp. P1-11]|uniref:hypothetical protein n=1 Tax=Methylobacterium sp. P1-11 TaxID=2024616 RepID=UPI0011EEF257|nr:hypothetical protein [Methylobacterium sp. P1-11]